MEKFDYLGDWSHIPLPDYVVADVNNLSAIENTTLRTKAAPVSFPLTNEDKRDIYLLIKKFKWEKDIAGLAAPQIGISKQVFVFEVSDIYEDQKLFPFSVWINPSYEKAGAKTDENVEECFSVKGVAGVVRRWASVHYKAYNSDGLMVQGQCDGVAARIIQHEIDHLNGKLFIDMVPKENLITTEEYRSILKEYSSKKRLK